jgi:hypothetical protein
MEEEDHIHSTQLLSLVAAFAAAAIGSPFFSLFALLSTLSLLNLCCSLPIPIYRQEWCHQLLLFFNNNGCQTLTFWDGLLHLSMDSVVH